jgi:hypothetical protein
MSKVTFLEVATVKGKQNDAFVVSPEPEKCCYHASSLPHAGYFPEISLTKASFCQPGKLAEEVPEGWKSIERRAKEELVRQLKLRRSVRGCWFRQQETSFSRRRG